MPSHNKDAVSLPPFQVSVHDSITVFEDLSAIVKRTYTYRNLSDTEHVVDLRQTIVFERPVQDLTCEQADIDLIPDVVGGLTREATWRCQTPVTLGGGDERVVVFMFRIPRFARINPPLVITHEIEAAVAATYSVSIVPHIHELFSRCKIEVRGRLLNTGMDAYSVASDGVLHCGPCVLSQNIAARFEVAIESIDVEPPTLPLLEYVAKRAPSRSFENYTVLLIPHLLGDFLSLLDAFEATGLNRDDTFIVGIPYSTKASVVLSLQHRGYTQLWTPSEYPFDGAVREAVEAAIGSAERTGKPLLIVEDGDMLYRCFIVIFRTKSR